ncbi:MAG: lysylphosphatidylglycerol synthase transmembrane domain-containing protein [Proteobacteria bacterium]|nr:lysylphosphatidylglycerol synthase transmembrane domain-containing protein [Pseudomonadota bacterium]
MPQQKIKRVGLNISKLLLVGGLLYWMVTTGKIDVDQMFKAFSDPSIVIPAIVVWLFGPVVIGTLRWWMLLKGANLECSWMKALRLQLIGFFFNTAMPGAVGGDIVKAIYIVKDQPRPSGKTSALLTVLLDRIVGLIGLFAMGAAAAIYNADVLLANSATQSLLKGLVLVFVMSLVFLGLVFIKYKNGNDPFRRFLQRDLPAFKTLLGIYDALRNYQTKPLLLFGTIGLSMVMQLFFMIFMGYLGSKLYPDAFDVTLLPAVFPFGILVTAVPIAPGGLGVGHAAFEKLFHIVGLPGGANIFNIYALSQLCLNLLCFIPYLLTMRNAPIQSSDLALESDQLT